MRPAQGAERFVTPEAVEVTMDLAGLGSRMIAALIDSAIQGAVLGALAFAIVGLELDETPTAALLLGALFLVVFGYFFAFEGMWAGRTPGKRAQRIRVVRTDGQPVGWAQVAVRNLLRLVDVLPTSYTVGALSILLTKRSQRLGDLAAGTVVVRDQIAPAPRALMLPTAASIAGSGLDATALRDAEYSVIRSFLDRRSRLLPAARQQLSAQLATIARAKVGGASTFTGGDEAFLEAVAASYRARFQPAPVEPSLPPPPA
jgi:uncharacterized RDD family membrane protein YckC